MRAAAFASIFTLAICIAAESAAEQNAVAFLKPDPAFNTSWDRCEARARARGMPPAKSGYGDFMEGCVGKISPPSGSAGNAVTGVGTTGAAVTRPR
jgi:hypothetical protein